MRSYIKILSLFLDKSNELNAQSYILIPSENMGVVFTGANYGDHPPNDEIMNSYILAAIN